MRCLKNAQMRICYAGTKRGTKFNNIKDPVKKSHQRDVVYCTTRVGIILVKQIEF